MAAQFKEFSDKLIAFIEAQQLSHRYPGGR